MEKELNADLESRRIFSELLHSINRLKFHLHLQVEMPETNVDFYLLAENIYIWSQVSTAHCKLCWSLQQLGQTAATADSIYHD